MGPLPKRKVSKSRRNRRRAHDSLSLPHLVFDNDTSIVASRQAGTARLHMEVAALLGQLAIKPVVLRPATPTSKGQVERTIRFLETSFVPLRTFTGLADLQAQHDIWAVEVAYARHHRR
ncbi:MAG: 50S ribosomal protein L32, partial [Phototrophicaceae bacterium]